MRILDLYCGEGGAAEGYRQAGATMIVGVDAKPQPRYPSCFGFIQADVLSLDVRFLRQFDLVHASPPCQFGTEMRHAPGARGATGHLNLIPATRALLQRAERAYVIENVRGVRAHLVEPISLFGFMFDNHLVTSAGQRFELSRERLFEANWNLYEPSFPRAEAEAPIANVFGGHLRARGGPYRTGGDTGRTVDFPGEDRPTLARQLMGMPWASMAGMSEAVPPSYTRYIGERFAEIRAQRSLAA